ncbi:PQQ-dependent sugar dehydrogenase [Algiphilus sp.]|uniref:PQQ-dependent sugar dehydrogenase n=1 Tax=Algiphilus sp. TaxID=1872431 RepID=UPI0032ED7C4A
MIPVVSALFAFLAIAPAMSAPECVDCSGSSANTHTAATLAAQESEDFADADGDGLGDDVDAMPGTPSNACAQMARFEAVTVQGGGLAQCAGPVTITVAPSVNVAATGRAEIYSPKTVFEGGFSLPRGAQLSVTATTSRVCEGAVIGDDGGPDGPAPLGSFELSLVPAFPDLSLVRPLALRTAPGDASDLYVATQGGIIYHFEARDDVSTGEASVFLDLSDRTRANGEQGLLGFAFHPDYASNGQVFAYYSANANPDVEVGDSVVARYIADPANRTADRTTETELLRFAQPFQNHNGGDLAFGTDGMLYISSGDGGGGNDSQNNAQDLENLLGKILRIAPDGSIPDDNPLVDIAGARKEIWAFGLRNPFRFSFDAPTQRLWTGDVGQGAQEEVDIIRGCGNYGWRIYEGTRSNINPDNRPLSDFQAPVHTYPRDMGRSITGGVVYRGTASPDLQGRYMYGDFISGRIWALSAESDGTLIENLQIGMMPNPSSFGVGLDGEPLMTSFDGRIYKLASQP